MNEEVTEEKFLLKIKENGPIAILSFEECELGVLRKLIADGSLAVTGDWKVWLAGEDLPR